MKSCMALFTLSCKMMYGHKMFNLVGEIKMQSLPSDLYAYTPKNP